MSNQTPPPSSRPTQPEPESLTGEKESIRKSQEEFIGDEATPSIDKSEYERRSRENTSGEPAREQQEGEHPAP